MAIEIQEHDKLVTIAGDGGVSLTVRRHRTFIDDSKYKNAIYLVLPVSQQIADELGYTKEDIDLAISVYVYVGSVFHSGENLGFEFIANYDKPEMVKAKVLGYIEANTVNKEIYDMMSYAILLASDKAPFGVNEVTSPPQEVDEALLADPK